MSDWGNQFIPEIEKLNVQEQKVAIWSVGNAGFVLKDVDNTIYIDPFFGGPPGPRMFRILPIPIEPTAIKEANLVLITHEHYDHCHPGTLTPIHSNTNAVFVGSKPVAELLLSWGFDKDRVKEIKPGDELVINNVKISVLESNDTFPGVKGAVMYIVECSGITFLHNGDSLYFNGFVNAGRRWDIDVALLSTARNPPGRQMYMTPYDILRAATDLKTKMLIPMHWDVWRHTCMDPSVVTFLARTLFPQVRVTILRLGDSLIFPDSF